MPFDYPRNWPRLRNRGLLGMTMDRIGKGQFKDKLTAENSERSILNTSSAIMPYRI
jgi:hypothetical protein